MRLLVDETRKTEVFDNVIAGLETIFNGSDCFPFVLKDKSEESRVTFDDGTHIGLGKLCDVIAKSFKLDADAAKHLRTRLVSTTYNCDGCNIVQLAEIIINLKVRFIDKKEYFKRRMIRY
jgi:hypothetical protein